MQIKNDEIQRMYELRDKTIRPVEDEIPRMYELRILYSGAVIDRSG